MIGIIPAAGHATRMMGLPKMLLPIPGDTTLIRRMRDSMQALNPRKICIGSTGVNLVLLEPLDRHTTKLYPAYTTTMSETVLLARQYAEQDEAVLFGMPDSYIEDTAVFSKLAKSLEHGADVAVGIFLTNPEQRHKLGMCRIDDDGRLLEVIDKPKATHLRYAWGVIAWKPVFWQHIHAADATIGYALTRAIEAQLNVYTVRLDGAYYDCGTPDEYFKLIREVEYESV